MVQWERHECETQNLKKMENQYSKYYSENLHISNIQKCICALNVYMNSHSAVAVLGYLLSEDAKK